MKFLIFALLAMTLHSIAEEKPHLSRDLGVAETALKRIAQNHDVDALMEVVEHSSLSAMQISAISAIGIPDNRTAAEMLRVLESRNVELLEGGTDQVNENAGLKMALMSAVAQALKLNTPQDASIPQVATFVAEAERLIKMSSPSRNHAGNGEKPAMAPNLPPAVQPPTPNKTPQSKPPISAPSEEPTSSTPWSIIVVVIAAAIGLLWLLLKK